MRREYNLLSRPLFHTWINIFLPSSEYSWVGLAWVSLSIEGVPRTVAHSQFDKIAEPTNCGRYIRVHGCMGYCHWMGTASTDTNWFGEYFIRLWIAMCAYLYHHWPAQLLSAQVYHNNNNIEHTADAFCLCRINKWVGDDINPLYIVTGQLRLRLPNCETVLLKITLWIILF